MRIGSPNGCRENSQRKAAREALYDCADQTIRVNADVREKACVFNRHNRALQIFRKLFVGEWNATFEREFADDGLAVVGKDFGDFGGTVFLQRIHFSGEAGETELIRQDESGQSASDDGQRNQRQHR